jgi:hypothetical protein
VSLESTNYDDFQKKQETKRNNLNDSLSSIHNRCETIFVEGTKKIFNKVRNLIKNKEMNLIFTLVKKTTETLTYITRHRRVQVTVEN